MEHPVQHHLRRSRGTVARARAFTHRSSVLQPFHFFAEWSGPKNGEALDFAFLDGFHTFEFLLRDFFNTEKHASARTLIGMHDCLPVTEHMVDRNEKRALERAAGGSYPYAWTGDVWKVIRILQEYRPDVSIVCVDAHPTGVVFVTNLDPTNTSLQDNYLKIVKQYVDLPNDWAEISKMYDAINIVGTNDILNALDHSLYFRV